MSVQWNDRGRVAAPRSRDRLRERLVEAELSVEREANGRRAATAQIAVLLEELGDTRAALARSERRADISARVLDAADNLVDTRMLAGQGRRMTRLPIFYPDQADQ